MACICANCRFYVPDGSGKGYCQLKDRSVKHDGRCEDAEEA